MPTEPPEDQASNYLNPEQREYAEILLEHARSVVEAHSELAEYFEAEANLTTPELQAREDQWAQANAREAIREEPW